MLIDEEISTCLKELGYSGELADEALPDQTYSVSLEEETLPPWGTCSLPRVTTLPRPRVRWILVDITLVNIPTTNFQAVVKEVPVVDLDPEDRTVLDLCFPEFLQEGDRMADYEDLDDRFRNSMAIVDGACAARSRREEEDEALPSSTTTNEEIARNPRLPNGLRARVRTQTLSCADEHLRYIQFDLWAQQLSCYFGIDHLGIAQLYTAYQSRPVHWGRLRRYAGSPELDPGRYYALCTREDGFDGGTLMNELMTYWSDATMVWPGLTDSTHLPPEERAQHAELDAPKLCIHVTRYGPRRRFLRSTTIEKLDEFVHLLPLPVRRVEIKNVLDLRIPEAQTWFFEYFVRLEEKIGLEGHVLDQSPDVRVSTFKYHKPVDCVDLLATLVVPGLGGSIFHQAVGAWLRSHDVAGLVYPSARCDASWQLLRDERDANGHGQLEVSFSGWNFVDYRRSGPADWKSLFGRLPTWVLPMRAGISVTRPEGEKPGWEIHGAEVAERRRVQLSIDVMLGKVRTPPDWDPRGGYRRPYYEPSQPTHERADVAERPCRGLDKAQSCLPSVRAGALFDSAIRVLRPK